MAVQGSIAWSLSKYPKIGLRIFSDAKTRNQEDNFESYIPRQLVQNLRQGKKVTNFLKQNNDVQLNSPKVISVISDPRKNPTDECELIQLTDLLTSATAQAVTASSIKKSKIKLGLYIAEKIADTYNLPWLQRHGLHRRFSVSYFPDQNGGFYKENLKVKEKVQERLL